jgi:hypothetical protein
MNTHKIPLQVLIEMQRYNKNFKIDEWENADYERCIDLFAKYYNDHLPVDLFAWSNVNRPIDSMVYKQNFYEQMDVLKYTVPSLFTTLHNFPTMVISTHASKSILLPVCKYSFYDGDLEVIVRCNFRDWVVSVNSKETLNIWITKDIFDPEAKIDDCMCEGIPEEYIYDIFKNDKNKFTFRIYSVYSLYAFLYLVKLVYETKCIIQSSSDVYKCDLWFMHCRGCHRLEYCTIKPIEFKPA